MARFRQVLTSRKGTEASCFRRTSTACVGTKLADQLNEKASTCGLVDRSRDAPLALAPLSLMCESQTIGVDHDGFPHGKVSTIATDNMTAGRLQPGASEQLQHWKPTSITVLATVSCAYWMNPNPLC